MIDNDTREFANELNITQCNVEYLEKENRTSDDVRECIYSHLEAQVTDHPLVYIATMVNIVILLLAVVIGIPANIYVLVRMTRLAKTDKEKYRRGTGVALWTLAASDLCAICLTAIQNITYVTPVPEMFLNFRFLNLFCKATLFSTHASTGISIWSWLLLSTLRYLAVRHPLYHLRLWRMPYRAIAFIICTSVAVNGFLLFSIVAAVQVDHNGGNVTVGFVECMENTLITQSVTLSFHALEIVWSFCVPFAMIVFMDASVVLKNVACPNLISRLRRRNRALRTVIINIKTTSVQIKKHHPHALRSWLTIALICILLNTPQNLLNCMNLLQVAVLQVPAEVYIRLHLNPFFRSFEIIAQTFYFGQFGFNAVYLVLFVFDKSIKPRSVNKEQVSSNTSRTGTFINNGYLSLKQSSL